jgi:hypothetical protein
MRLLDFRAGAKDAKISPFEWVRGLALIIGIAA